MRRNKTNYYLDIAETVAARGTCLRRNYGAIIVKNDEIISTGYGRYYERQYDYSCQRAESSCCESNSYLP